MVDDAPVRASKDIIGHAVNSEEQATLAAAVKAAGPIKGDGITHGDRLSLSG